MDQRKAQRFLVWFPVRIVGPGAENDSAQLGVTHNLSEQGVLLASGRPLSAGDEICVAYKVSMADLTEKNVKGRIVRVDRNEEDPNGLWPYRMAVHFEHPLEGVESMASGAPAQPSMV